MNERITEKKEGRYKRLLIQLKELLDKSSDPLARMATIVAVLHHKMTHYFWTGFYFKKGDELIVGPYQGPVACQVLGNNKGVCWAAVNRGEAVIVSDVEQFPGHVACDSRSQSEITLPVYDASGEIIAVFDVDAREKNQFDETDSRYLSEILKLIYKDL